MPQQMCFAWDERTLSILLATTPWGSLLNSLGSVKPPKHLVCVCVHRAGSPAKAPTAAAAATPLAEEPLSHFSSTGTFAPGL